MLKYCENKFGDVNKFGTYWFGDVWKISCKKSWQIPENPSKSMDFWLQTTEDHQVPPETLQAWGPKQLHWLSRNVRRPTPVAPGKKTPRWPPVGLRTSVHDIMMISLACYSISHEIGHMIEVWQVWRHVHLIVCRGPCFVRSFLLRLFPSWHVASDLDDLGSQLMRSLVNWQPVLRLRDMSVWMKETLQVLWAKLKTTLQ